MTNIRVPNNATESLFMAELRATASATRDLKVTRGIGEGEIKLILGKRNRVAIGVPHCEDLVARFRREKTETPTDIEDLLPRYDFRAVFLSCSFLPDPGCRFVWARLGVELHSQPTRPGLRIAEPPIVHDMFPDEVTVERKYKRSSILSPKLRTLGVGSVKEEREFVVYRPQIFAFGLGTPNPAWDFQSTKERGIWGNMRDLLLVIRTRKGTKVKAKFIIAAEVELCLLGWLRVPVVTRRDDEAANAHYAL